MSQIRVNNSKDFTDFFFEVASQFCKFCFKSLTQILNFYFFNFRVTNLKLNNKKFYLELVTG